GFWSRMPMRPDDVKYAVRRLVRAPAFTLVAVLSLALGIGANTAMFSLVNAVLIRQLPVRAPEELVEVYTSEEDGYPYATSSYPDLTDLRERDDVFASVVGTRTFIGRVDLEDRPEIAFGEAVSWDYFPALGVPMELGRSFLPEEDEAPGTHPVVVLGHRTWERLFGADPGVVGSSVRLDGRPYTVVGVAPEAFTGSMPVLVTGLYVPSMQTADLAGFEGQLEQRGSRSLFIKARLRPGVTVEQANASLAAFSAALAEAFPESNRGRVMSALPSGDVALHPLVDRALKPVAALLLGVVGLVLLIACANLASFLLARAEERRKEIAVRLALGAGRGALVRQLLVETTLLALLGGAAGLVLADGTLGLLMGFQPPLPIPVDFDVSLDRTVLLFTAGVSLAAGIAFGLAPALQATRPDIAPTLKNEGTGTGHPARFRLRNGLVVTQVAFSFVLLIGAGLFVRSLQKAQRIDPGFDVGPAALVWPMPEMSGYSSDEEVETFYRVLEERLLAHPAIERVAMADRLPLGAGVQTAGYVLPGVPTDAADGEYDIDNTTVSATYFETMGVPLLLGRAFEGADVDGGPVAIVSEAFVRRFYPGEDVVGRTLERGGETPLTIVGVARDTKVRTLGEAPRPFVYELRGQRGFFGTQVVVKGQGTSAELLAAARSVIDEVDPDLVLMDARTMNDHLAIMLFPPRMAALLLTVFGGLALTLAAVGIYGTVSHAVARRTRELGIRMSLGASARDVVVMAVGGGMRLVLVGAAIGVALAGAVTWTIAGFLFGIGATDLATFTAIPLLLCGVALLAAWVPARRASAVDPVRALRGE
ncbi:MAG TPA: ABC transporter permease, partial [Longimicrobiales bacterium]|nr:ABC transporter permease [Longimicrobiales bacterium]